MDLKIHRLDKSVDLPSYAKKGDAALDIRSSEEYTLKPNERYTFKTGLKLEIPEGYAGLVWDKSGVAHNFGVHCLAGVIDSSYRGELMIVLFNTSKEDFSVRKNMKIAQLLIQKVETVDVVDAESLKETIRGEARFGSTGLH